MKTNGIKILTIVSGLLFGETLKAQGSSRLVTESFKVSGNCGMCKKTIETAVKGNGVKSADWNETSKTLTVKYDKTKTSRQQLLRSVAYAGYDNEEYLAPDAAYSKLHGCCQYDRTSKPAAAKHENHETITGTGKQPGAVQTQESGIRKVYDQYFSVKDALVKSDPSSAANAASQLLESIEKVNMDALTTNEHDNYMKSAGKIKEQALAITKSKNLEKQRTSFSKLSDLMYDLMKTIHPGQEVYLDHCPMYNDGKGANWISKEKAIRNPYYGSKMMTCGSVRETIK